MKIQTSMFSGYMGIVITAMHWSISPFLITWLKLLMIIKDMLWALFLHIASNVCEFQELRLLECL